MPKIVRPAIAGLPVYVSGIPAEVIQQKFNLTAIAKLDSNENPYGMSPRARDAARGAIDEAFRYPDRDETHLRQLIAADLDVDPRQLVFSGGSEDVLAIIYQMVLSAGDTVVTVTPGFGLHAICGQICDAKIVVHPHTDDWRFPVDDIVASIHAGARIVAIASPSNPVGTMMSAADVERIIEAAGTQCLLLFDEAYIEFAGPEWHTLVLERMRSHNGPWAVLRTFAKAHGLAGMRIGYGVVHDVEFADNFNKTRSPFNVNAVALAAAEAAYADKLHVQQVVQTLADNRLHTQELLAVAGFSNAPSRANFLFVDCGTNGAAMAEQLQRHGVLVKPWFEPGYESYVRATIGLRAECDALVAALVAARDALS
ncbi:MAG: histidinol-phosphate aminotransferase [Gammaproteobacteria bacterium]|nr:histidinol-phosphate aminotransferase [Gammaproteobacteria bacterium]